jgi:hypothetical protein
MSGSQLFSLPNIKLEVHVPTRTEPSADSISACFRWTFRIANFSKEDVRIRLPGQPFEILLILPSCPGVVVTREFEHGLKAAMKNCAIWRRFLVVGTDSSGRCELSYVGGGSLSRRPSCSWHLEPLGGFGTLLPSIQ